MHQHVELALVLRTNADLEQKNIYAENILNEMH
jgi:hypothetical protein